MEGKLAEFTNKGMYKDADISKQPSEFAYHNKNIRITSLNGETLFSVTNEKMPEKLDLTLHRKKAKNYISQDYRKRKKLSPSPSGLYLRATYATDNNVVLNGSFKGIEEYGFRFRLRRQGSHDFSLIDFVAKSQNGFEGETLNNVKQIPDGQVSFDDYKSWSDATINFVQAVDENDPNDIIYVFTRLINDVMTPVAYRRVAIEDFEQTVYEDDPSYLVLSEETGLPSYVLWRPYNPLHVLSFLDYIYDVFGNKEYINNKLDKDYIENFTVNQEVTILEGLIGKQISSIPVESIIIADEEFGPLDLQVFNLSGNIVFSVNSITQESQDGSNKYYYTLNKNDEESIIVNLDGILLGTYIGHCVSSNYITIFTHDETGEEKKDRIYRLEQKENDGQIYFDGVLLFEGDLSFCFSNPIETLFFYESEDIQKVYWVDGKNRPRVINIKKEDYVLNDNVQFEFVPEIKETPKVIIEKRFDGTGSFHSGTIQYYISYYNKFGAESKIAWSSDLYYVAPEERGGRPDEFVGCSFKLDISNIDSTFDYIKIYSAKRNSLDGPIELNVVADLKVKDIEHTTVIDDGINNTAIDSNLLYFIGGEDFIVGTLAQKDNTLFMGNIKLLGEEESYTDLKTYISNNWITNSNGIKESTVISFNEKTFDDAYVAGFYPYRQQINMPSAAFKTFKYGEIYRFAIQYQNKRGTWSQPIWIGDKKCDISPTRTDDLSQISVANAVFTVDSSDEYIALASEYSSYRILMAETNANNRSIVAQGIVNPTLFKYDQRVANKPFSFASYIMRPRNSNVEFRHFCPVSEEVFGLSDTMLPMKKTEDPNMSRRVMKIFIQLISAFAIVGWDYVIKIQIKYAEFNAGEDIEDDERYEIVDEKYIGDETGYDLRKNLVKKIQAYFKSHNLDNIATPEDIKKMLRFIEIANSPHTGWYMEKVGQTFFANIRNYYRYKELLPGETMSNTFLFDSFKENDNDIEDVSNQLYVDESIVTLNSPDLEDNQYIIDNNSLKFRLVGIAPITSNKSDFKIDFKTDSISSSSSGIVDNVPSQYIIDNISTNTKTLLSDYIYNNKAWEKITEGDDAGEYNIGQFNTRFKVYMWHKDGSIWGADLSKLKKDVLQYSVDVIDKKIFSNARFSLFTEYFDPSNIRNISISNPQIFNTDGIILNKVNICNTPVTYYGNYKTAFRPWKLEGEELEYDESLLPDESYGDAISSSDPIKISFKSLPHAVFSLCNKNKNEIYILPNLTSDVFVDNLEKKNYIFRNVKGSPEIEYVDPEDIETNTGLQTAFSAGILWSTNPIVQDEQDIINYVMDIANLEFSSQYSGDIDEELLYDITNDNKSIFVFVAEECPESEIPKILLIYRIYGTIDLSNIYHAEISTYNFKEDYPIAIIDNNSVHSDYNFSNDISSFYIDNYNVITLPIKYEYTSISQINYDSSYPYLYIGELYRDIDYNNLYGGYDENALERITWIPISEQKEIRENIKLTEGDTYYQRWDCLKTLPYDPGDPNQVIDITSVMLESHINLDGRYDRNRGFNDIINISNANFNLFNTAYNQTNNNFKYNILDDKYDLDKFSNQIAWSLQKNPTSEIDEWTSISLLSLLNLNGEYGPINKLVNYNDNILAFQDSAIAAINFNNQTQISTEQGLPIEVINSGKVNGYKYVTTLNGCKNKWALGICNSGLYFVDDLRKSFMAFNKDGLQSISGTAGFSNWFKEHGFIDGLPLITNFCLSYDSVTKDIYLRRKSLGNEGSLCFNEELSSFTSFLPYNDTWTMFNLNGDSFVLSDDMTIKRMFDGDYTRDFSIEYKINPEPLLEKTFTNIEYIADTIDNGELQMSNPFMTLTARNEFQNGSTNLLNSRYPNSNIKFRIWRADIPRDSEHVLDRMHNPWINLSLIGNDNIDGKTTFHSLLVKYFK